ncbi:MAG TPA: 23S rRNA (pseudouridine(1915)-N(3))-methyltransferase RlmH [Burkholderiales bacterium]|nr:23S rRNA (pseudouridine(1915)-N(3))-methyltransferase RlmH [Burkholderiales bacterium]
MARLHVVAIAARLPAWAETACAEYARRMPKGYEIERIALKDESRLRKALPAFVRAGARVVALDERGRELTTAQFARLLDAPSAFVIGGADGLSDETKGQAQLTLRLSAMTLPHALAQVVLLEQLYRAATLLTGHPYHRA